LLVDGRVFRVEMMLEMSFLDSSKFRDDANTVGWRDPCSCNLAVGKAELLVPAAQAERELRLNTSSPFLEI
jgi:hypothetical protein